MAKDMFNSKTLFVLGAGASSEARMPVGTQLISQIADALDIRFELGHLQESGSYEIVDAWRAYVRNLGERDINPYLHAAWDIRNVAPMATSIDDVLDRRQDDEKIKLCGKLAIAHCILNAERQSALYINPPIEEHEQRLNHSVLKNTWYYPFVNMLIQGVPKSRIESVFNNISIISFNYDRCLKHFLIYALNLHYGIKLSEAESLVKNLVIIHPYGSVSPLQFEKQNGLQFGARINGNRLLDVSMGIKTFTEQMDDEVAIEQIKIELGEAQKVIFLGFGFHKQNMDILRLESQQTYKKIYGTVYGFSKPDTDVVSQNLKAMFKIKSVEQGIFLRDLTCADFFKEFSLSLQS